MPKKNMKCHMIKTMFNAMATRYHILHRSFSRLRIISRDRSKIKITDNGVATPVIISNAKPSRQTKTSLDDGDVNERPENAPHYVITITAPPPPFSLSFCFSSSKHQGSVPRCLTYIHLKWLFFV